jgi:hypothetical protein
MKARSAQSPFSHPPYNSQIITKIRHFSSVFTPFWRMCSFFETTKVKINELLKEPFQHKSNNTKGIAHHA